MIDPRDWHPVRIPLVVTASEAAVSVCARLACWASVAKSMEDDDDVVFPQAALAQAHRRIGGGGTQRIAAMVEAATAAVPDLPTPGPGAPDDEVAAYVMSANVVAFHAVGGEAWGRAHVVLNPALILVPPPGQRGGGGRAG
jgi:hypothetical protein